jgi:2-methylcitrate dehydratase PrpD
MMVNFVAETGFDDLPEEVVHHTKRVILDTIGCSLAGSKTDVSGILLNLVRELGGTPESSLLGTVEKTSCANAALVNAKNANELDFDDTFRNIIHLASTCVVPALCVGERVRTTGRDLILSVALGYDIEARLLMGCGSHDLFKTGDADKNKVPPASVHVFGGTAAVSKILGLGKNEIMNAFGIAGATPQLGNIKHRLPWKFVKYGEPGFNSHTAVLACLLAQKGYTGPADIFDYEDGFWGMLNVPRFDFNAFTEGLGKHWYILENQFKHYPCCHHIQNPAALTERIVRQHNLKEDEISGVTVRGTPLLLDKVLSVVQPVDDITAQFSIAHVIAMVVFGVEVGPEWQNPKQLSDPKVSAFRKKVKVELLPSSLESFASKKRDFGWKKLPAEVEIVARGEIFRDQQDNTKGDNWLKETRSTDEELKEKFRRNAYSVSTLSNLWRRKVENAIETIFELENLRDVNDLTRLVVPY